MTNNQRAKIEDIAGALIALGIGLLLIILAGIAFMLLVRVTLDAWKVCL